MSNPCSRLLPPLKHSVRYLLVIAGITFLSAPACHAGGPSPLSNAASADKAAVEQYAAQILKVQELLRDGEPQKAAEILQSSPEEHRGFEYEWLRAEVEAGGSGNADSRLQVIPFPSDTQARYGLLHPEIPLLVFICRDGSLRRIRLDDQSAELPKLDHPDGAAVWRGMFSADGSRFVSAHGNGDVLVRATDSWDIVDTLKLGDRPVTDLSVSGDGRVIAATGTEAVEVWQLQGDSYGRTATLEERYRFGNGIAVKPDGSVIATGGMFDARFWNPDGSQAREPVTHASYTMGLLFSPDGTHLASAPRGNINKLFAVYRVSDGLQVSSAGPFQHYVAGMAFTPDGRRLVATGCENLLRVFDVQTAVPVLTINRKECGAAPGFTLNGRALGWNERNGFQYLPPATEQ